MEVSLNPFIHINLRTNGFFGGVGVSQEREKGEESLQLVGGRHREDGVRGRLLLTQDVDHPHARVVPGLGQGGLPHVAGTSMHLGTAQRLLYESGEIHRKQISFYLFKFFLYRYSNAFKFFSVQCNACFTNLEKFIENKTKKKSFYIC